MAIKYTKSVRIERGIVIGYVYRETRLRISVVDSKIFIFPLFDRSKRLQLANDWADNLIKECYEYER